MIKEATKTEENYSMPIKMQDVFSRMLGMIILLYGFLILDMPTQYGFGLTENPARFVALIMIILGAYLALRK